MSRIVLAAVATPVHVFPMFTIAEHLIGQGHDVTIFSGSLFQQQAETLGANFVPFDKQVDIDYRCLEKYFPERAELPPGNAQMALPLLQKPAEKRIPVIAIGVTPLAWSTKDAIFWGARIPPELLPADLTRDQLIDKETHQLIEQVREAFNRSLAAVGYPPLTGDHNDVLMSRVDRFLQLATQSFEFIRDDLPETVDFIGSLPVKVEDDKAQISWPDESLPLILVTQGTLANIDFNQLILPTLRGLATLPVRVLAITGGRSINILGEDLPENARVVEYLNFEDWLPRASIFITNGGYGSLNSAIRHGVPLVVAGTGDGKLEAVARVIWSRCGISLHTDTPNEQQLYQAVTRILSSPIWRQQSQIIKADYDAHNALASITRHINELITQ
ncbi:glycosyltransferase [Xenorhabdus eapokensis]|uniref:Putative glycosyl transferase n=1 Tax=Xenorhabdus eapokensis TaxID=1873482 RepID=A0A1Q5TLY0_9GAMM|nr:nucleotide disphospho-sugar-binding domain-containing protein [Xenorhabdus eapokensis]OKP01237.1 putative glycosyl transferase [Xenorhabdus eapokensis]